MIEWVSFLNGATAMACLAIALFFLHFWYTSEDRLFLCLSAAFVAFAANYALLGLLPSYDERRTYAFVLRLVGFVSIFVGLLIKQREFTEHLANDPDRF